MCTSLVKIEGQAIQHLFILTLGEPGVAILGNAAISGTPTFPGMDEELTNALDVKATKHFTTVAASWRSLQVTLRIHNL
jgi:hypothetical protein